MSHAVKVEEEGKKEKGCEPVTLQSIREKTQETLKLCMDNWGERGT